MSDKPSSIALENAVEYFRRGKVVPVGTGDLPVDQYQQLMELLAQYSINGSILVSQIEHMTGLKDQLDAAVVRRIQAENKARQLEMALEKQSIATQPPRTIVLTYMPFVQTQPNGDEPVDCGGYWTIGEAGRYQDRLDTYEVIPLVSAMLLGAPHPALRSILEIERAREMSVRRRNTPLITHVPIREEPSVPAPTPDLEPRYETLWEITASGDAKALPIDWYEKKGYPSHVAQRLRSAGLYMAEAINAQRHAGEVVDAEWPGSNA